MKKVFLIILSLVIIGIVIPQDIIFAQTEENIALKKDQSEKILKSLIPQIEAKKVIDFDYLVPKEQAALVVTKLALQTELSSYLLFEVPKSMAKSVLNISIKLARLLLGDDTAIAGILGEIEKKSVEAAREYAMDWFWQNEIKVGNGNLNLNYSTVEGKWQKTVFSYAIVQKPIDAKNSEVAIDFNSPDIIKAPALISAFQWEGGINQIPPFILRIKGKILETDLGAYRWVVGPKIEIIFDESVPRLQISEEGWKEKITSWIDKEIDYLLGKTKDLFSNFNPFKAQVSPEMSRFQELEETKQEIEQQIQEVSQNEELPANDNTEADLEKMQNLLDDIAEQIDVLSERISKLVPEPEEEIAAVPILEPVVPVVPVIPVTPVASVISPASYSSGGGGGGGGSGSSSKTPEISWCQISGNSSQNKVIFSKIAWMGDENSSNNEWFELKNITQSSINLNNWQIFDKDKQIKISFGPEVNISASGFYLMKRTADYAGALNDTDEALYLFDANCSLQDQVIANPDWPAGDKEKRVYMERKDDLTWYDSLDSIIDTETQSDLEPGPEPQPEQPESPIETETSSGSVIFNEVAWMGTKASSDDEWIELYNSSSEPIDLSGWQIKFTPLAGEPRIIVLEENTPTIAALSYFLMERTDETTISDITADYIYKGALNDDGGVLELFDSANNLIDKIDCSSGWLAGKKEEGRVSMERAYGNIWASNNLIIHQGHDANSNKIWGTPKSKNSVSISPTEIIEQLPFDEFEKITLPLISSPYIIRINLSVPESKTLFIEKDVINKFYNTSAGMTVLGTLKADDSVFTSFSDNPNYGFWGRLYFGPTSVNSELKNILLNYAGGDPAGTPCSDEMAGIRIEKSSVLIENSIIEKNQGRGITLIESASIINNSQIIDNPPCFGSPYYYGGFGVWVIAGSPTITNSLIKQNDAGIFIDNYASPIIENNNFENNKRPVCLYRGSPSFSGNQANNNEINGIYVYGSIDQNAIWKKDLPYVVSGNVSVAENVTLTLEPGVNVDFYDSYSGLSISGALKANNVEFSSYNKTTALPGFWNKIYFGPTSKNSELNKVSFNYAGGGFGTPCSPDMASILVDQSSISLTNAVVNSSQYDGIILINSDSLLNNVAVNSTVFCSSLPYNYGGFGINVNGGNPLMENLSFENNANCNILLNSQCYAELPAPEPLLPTVTP